MNAVTLSATQAEPEAWPAVSGLSDEAQELDAGPIWRCLEVWAGARFAVRLVTYEVEGPGTWAIPLVPATLVDAERYASGWQPVQLVPHPDRPGWRLGDGLYRIVAEVGAAPPPVAVEAYRRLAEYLAQRDNVALAGATSVSAGLDGATEAIQRPAAWVARALHYSGAADVLRPIRRVRRWGCCRSSSARPSRWRCDPREPATPLRSWPRARRGSPASPAWRS